jgi:hypothetical protein
LILAKHLMVSHNVSSNRSDWHYIKNSWCIKIQLLIIQTRNVSVDL